VRWSELPGAAKKYILYHTLWSPVGFSWILFPYLLYLEGFSPLDLGILYTATAVAGIPLRILLGKAFTTRDIRVGLAAVDAIQGASLGLMYLAQGPQAPLVAAASLLVASAADPLLPLYPAYERAVYPEDRMEEALVWHMALPEASGIASYLALGLLFAGVRDPAVIRLAFLAAAGYEALLIVYDLRVLEPVVLAEQARGGGAPSLRALLDALRGRLALFLAVYLLYLAAWRLAPLFVFENYVIKTYGKGILGIALVQAAMSTASLASMAVINRLPRGLGLKALAAASLGVSASLLGFYLAPPFPVLVALSFAARGFDATWFLYGRTWFFSLISREEAAAVSAGVSAARETLFLAMPLIAGTLAEQGARTPYLAASILAAATVPLIYAAQRASRGRAQGAPETGNPPGGEV